MDSAESVTPLIASAVQVRRASAAGDGNAEAVDRPRAEAGLAAAGRSRSGTDSVSVGALLPTHADGGCAASQPAVRAIRSR